MTRIADKPQRIGFWAAESTPPRNQFQGKLPSAAAPSHDPPFDDCPTGFLKVRIATPSHIFLSCATGEWGREFIAASAGGTGAAPRNRLRSTLRACDHVVVELHCFPREAIVAWEKIDGTRGAWVARVLVFGIIASFPYMFSIRPEFNAAQTS